MRFRTETHRILRGHPTTWHDTHGSNQNPGSSGLASTDHSNGCQVFPRVHRILPVFHPELLQNRQTPTTTNEKRHDLGMGKRSKTSLRTPQNSDVSTPSTRPTKLQQTLRRAHRRISLWRGRHTLTRGRATPKRQNLKTITPPNSVLLGHVHSSGKKLRHL